MSLIEYSSKDLDTIAQSTANIVVNPLFSYISAEEISASQV